MQQWRQMQKWRCSLTRIWAPASSWEYLQISQLEISNVKRKSSFYHLPEWIPIKYAFQGLRGTWFLQVEGRLLNGSNSADLSKHVAAEVGNHAFHGSNLTKSLAIASRRKNGLSNEKGKKEIFNRIKTSQQELPKVFSYSGKKRKRKQRINNLEHPLPPANENINIDKEMQAISCRKNLYHFLSEIEFESATKCHPASKRRTPSKRFQQVITDANINGRYSSSFCEESRYRSPSVSLVASTIHSRLPQQLKAQRDVSCSTIGVDTLPQLNLRTPPRISPSLSQTDSKLESSRNKPRGAEIGKRLLTASNNIIKPQNKHRSAISICRTKNRKYERRNAASIARYMAFEMSSSDG
ncbi:uncharacterized protein LOC110820604 isoform X2 [Carica papaya]|uniref:uncharacterized protein LOC110820604 isoform X2 n=1 Tax=Carica papaya TaxID=3649 RepID=UPI000B8CACC4|nr:uncharacterized protein LOC110820604 isoform X2 [Carica papaya]